MLTMLTSCDPAVDLSYCLLVSCNAVPSDPNAFSISFGMLMICVLSTRCASCILGRGQSIREVHSLRLGCCISRYLFIDPGSSWACHPYRSCVFHVTSCHWYFASIFRRFSEAASPPRGWRGFQRFLWETMWIELMLTDWTG